MHWLSNEEKTLSRVQGAAVERMAPYIANFAVDSAVVVTRAVALVSADAVP